MYENIANMSGNGSSRPAGVPHRKPAHTTNMTIRTALLGFWRRYASTPITSVAKNGASDRMSGPCLDSTK